MHNIRLRKPWTRWSLEHKNERIDVPDLQEPTTVESVRYQRAFNTPTGLGDQTRVLLRIQGWEGSLNQIELNEHVIEVEGNTRPLEVDITDFLASGNRLTLTLCSLPGAIARLSGEVTLVIIET